MQTVVYLVRHGEIHNPNKVVKGRLPGFGLNSLGRAQILHAAKCVKGKVAVIYASPLLRAQESARIIASVHHARIVRSFALNEWNQVSWQGKPSCVVQQLPEYKTYLKRPTLLRIGETYTQLASRVLDFFKRVVSKHRGETVVFVTHGEPFALLLLALQHKSLDAVHKNPYPEKGGVVRIVVGKKPRITWLVGKRTSPSLKAIC